MESLRTCNRLAAATTCAFALLSAPAPTADAMDINPAGFHQTGKASWYGGGFHGQRTASGSRFDQHALTAAHRSLPLGTEVTVTNIDNGKSVTVVINDRGPYVRGRVIDLSKRAARDLGFVEDGLAKVAIAVTAPPEPEAQPPTPEVKPLPAVQVAEAPDPSDPDTTDPDTVADER